MNAKKDGLSSLLILEKRHISYGTWRNPIRGMMPLASCLTPKKGYLLPYQDRIKFALGLKDILLNAEGLGEKEKEGLALLIEEIEKRYPKCSHHISQ